VHEALSHCSANVSFFFPVNFYNKSGHSLAKTNFKKTDFLPLMLRKRFAGVLIVAVAKA
jgi:hypothetical protein